MQEYINLHDQFSLHIQVWFYSAFAHFMAHTLDGIDGKQARRTGSSSPLGEMFDHGLDSWSTSLFLINFISRMYVM